MRKLERAMRNNDTSKQQDYERTMRNDELTKQRNGKTTKGRCKTTKRRCETAKVQKYKTTKVRKYEGRCERAIFQTPKQRKCEMTLSGYSYKLAMALIHHNNHNNYCFVLQPQKSTYTFCISKLEY